MQKSKLKAKYTIQRRLRDLFRIKKRNSELHHAYVCSTSEPLTHTREEARESTDNGSRDYNFCFQDLLSKDMSLTVKMETSL